MGLVSLVLSLAYHLQLDLASLVVVDTVTALLNREIQGSLEIGELHNVTYEKIVAERVIIRDPQGREVIRVNRLAAWPNWGALWDGTIFVDRARARGGEVVLYVAGEEDETVSLVEAFLPVTPGEPGGAPPPLIVVNDIVIDDVTVRGDVPSYEGLRLEGVRLAARVEARSDVNFRVFDGNAEMTGPYPGRTSIDRIVGHFNTDMTDGLDAFARAHRGDSRVRARIRLWQEGDDEEAPLRMDLRASVDPMRMATLAEMEIAPGLDNLTGTFRGAGRMHGPTDDLRLDADVTSEGGRLIGRGHFPSEGPITLEAWTHGDHRLDQLVPVAPRMRIGAHATLALDEDPVTGEPVRRLHADVAALRYQQIAIPGFSVDGLIGDDELTITDLDTTVADGEASATGTIGYDGSLDLTVSASVPDIARDPNVRRFAPGARGSLVTRNLRIQADEELTNFRGSGTVALRGLRYGSVRASTLRVSGRVGGEMPAPTVSVDGDATGLEVGGLRLGTADVGLHGGPGGYEVAVATSDAQSGTRASLTGRARLTEDTLSLRSTDVMVDLGAGEAWRGEVDMTLRMGHSVELDPIRLVRPGEAITARGTYRFHGDDDVSVELEGVTLDGLDHLAPEALAGIGGRVDGTVRLDGDLDRRPQGRVALQIRDGAYRGLDGISGRVDLGLEGESLDTDVALDLGARGRLFARGPIGLTREALADPSRIAEDADLSQLDVRTDNLDLGAIGVLAGTALPVAGRITTDIRLGGTGLRPEIQESVVVLDEIGLAGWDPIRAKLRVRYGQGRVQVRHLWVADAVGELVSGEAELPLDLEDLPDTRAAFWQQVHRGGWSASVRLASRRLDSYPAPLDERMPPGILASASLTAEGDASGPHADVAAVLRVVELSGDDACSSSLRPYAVVRASLDGDRAEGTIRGFGSGSSPVLLAEIGATLPVAQWVERGEVTQVPDTEVRATFDGLDLAELPYACGYGRGPIYGTANLTGLFTDRPRLGAVVDMPELRLWETAGSRGDPTLSEAFQVHVRAGSAEEGDALTACAILGMAGAEGTPPEQCRMVRGAAPGEMLSRLRVPVRWTAGEALPAYDDTRPIRSWNDFSDVRAEPVLAFIPGIVAGDVVVDGQVELTGPWETIQLNGAVDMRDGSIQIEGLGQHLQNIHGRVELYGDEALLPHDDPLTATDSGGTVLISGNVGFEGVYPRSVGLTLAASAFPVRREGMVLAWLTGNALLEGQIRDDETLSSLEIHNFDVRLPEQTAATLQALELHPQVLVVGSQRILVGPQRDSYPLEFRVDAGDPFWVRRTDFAAQLTADITATYADPDLTVEGRATIHRGTFEIFGKRFELRTGGITFDGGTELNPQVRVVAVYEIPGRSGATVTVEVTGSLEDPHVAFTSTESANQAEIIGLLVAGGRSRGASDVQDAAAQASSFVSNLAAGLLTLTLRQEFGDVLPVLAIESQGIGGTRIRAGFDVDELIPDFLDGIVTGLYLEGFVTAATEGTNAAGTSSGGGGVGGGISVEATFPSDFLMRGTWVPIDNGGLELLWEP